MQLWKRIRQLWRKRQFEADLAEEIRLHREMSGGAAFGPVALAMEQSRAVWGFGWLDALAGDIRYALRGFHKTPGFAVAVIGTIGLALGLNTMLFTFFNAYVLRPIAVRDPYSLYLFQWNTGRFGHRMNLPEFQELQRQPFAFSDVMGFQNGFAPIAGRGSLVQVVTGNYFTLLGTGMQLGRPILESDSLPGAPPVTVISYVTWKSRFQSDPNIIGTTTHLGGRPMQIIGVTGPQFVGLEVAPVEFWVPLTLSGAVNDGPDIFGPEHPNRLTAIGRLRPGVTPKAAEAALAAWAQQMTAGRPREEKATGIVLEQHATPLPIGLGTMGFSPLLAAFGLVLMIACANVSNMMLARALSRQREMGIRVSLGAGRGRLIRQLLTESVLLALPAAAAGYLISESTLRAVQAALFATAPHELTKVLRLLDLSPDIRVYGYLLLGAAASTVLFGLVPAIQTTRSNLISASRGDFTDRRPERLRNGLVVAQVTVCSLLLIVTLVVLKAEHLLLTRDLGISTRQVFDLRVAQKSNSAAAERLRGEALVELVGAAFQAPLDGGLPAALVARPGGGKMNLDFNLVSPEFFDVFRIRLLRGRTFTTQEAREQAAVAVVSEATAQLLWPGDLALGQTIELPSAIPPVRKGFPRHRSVRVIGVAANATNGWAPNGSQYNLFYLPTSPAAEDRILLVRMRGDADAGRRAIEASLERMAPSVVERLLPMDERAAMQRYPFHLTLAVAAFLAALALVLTVSGVYGVLSYLVNQRAKEIGIRIALGAGGRSVVRMVLTQSTRLAAIGAVCGAVLALALARIMAHEMEVLNPYEFVAYAGAVVVVLAATVGASFFPTRRATRIDPMTALRCD